MATKKISDGGATAPPKKTKEQLTKEEKAEKNAQIIRAAVSALELRPVNPKDIKSITERVTMYFNTCAERNARPSLPGLCNVMGVDKLTWRRWVAGDEGREIAYIAQRTMGALEAIWADLSMDGSLMPASGIFGAKNWYGYKDTPEDVKPTGVSAEADLDALVADARLLPEYIITQEQPGDDTSTEDASVSS